jgi:hypothetical protein
VVDPPRRRELWLLTGILLLVGILLLATLLRIAWPTLTEFKFSEARLEALALELTQEGRLPLVGVPSSAGFDHSPLSVYLYVPAFLWGTNPIPATIYGGLVGAAAVVLCFWLARHFPGGSPTAALIAALLFAVSPWAVAFSRKIWQVTFVPLLALAFVGLAVSALVEGRRWHLAWAIAAYAVLVQVHPSAISLAPALLLWLLLFWRQVRLGPLLVGGGLGLLSAAPFLIHQAQSGWPLLAAYRALPESGWNLDAVRLAWEAVTGRGIHALAGEAYPLLNIVPEMGWLFNLVGWLVVGAGLVLAVRLLRCWRSPADAARVDLMLLTWLLMPILFNLRSSLELYLHFYALILPAAYLIVGRGVALLVPQSLVGRRAAGVGLSLLAALQVVALVLMARFVSSHDTPGGFGTPLGTYLDLADRAVAEAKTTGAAEVLVVGQGDSPVVDEVPAIFDVLLRRRVTYRFVDGESAALFPLYRAVALLAPKAGAVATWYGPGQALPAGYQLVSLDGSWPDQALHPTTGPHLFQNGVDLLGYTWAPAGSGGRFWLGWQVLWLSPDDTHFFVHLLRDGAVVGQQDGVGYPNASRHKGDRVISGFDITLPEETPDIALWARSGVYRYPEVVNVPLIDQVGNPVGDAVLMGPLEEGP